MECGGVASAFEPANHLAELFVGTMRWEDFIYLDGMETQPGKRKLRFPTPKLVIQFFVRRFLRIFSVRGAGAEVWGRDGRRGSFVRFVGVIIA